MDIKTISVWIKQSKSNETYLSVNIEFENGESSNFAVFKNKSENPNAPQFRYWKKSDNASGAGKSGNFCNIPPDWTNPVGASGSSPASDISPDDIFQPPDNDDDLPF